MGGPTSRTWPWPPSRDRDRQHAHCRNCLRTGRENQPESALCSRRVSLQSQVLNPPLTAFPSHPKKLVKRKFRSGFRPTLGRVCWRKWAKACHRGVLRGPTNVMEGKQSQSSTGSFYPCFVATQDPSWQCLVVLWNPASQGLTAAFLSHCQPPEACSPRTGPIYQLPGLRKGRKRKSLWLWMEELATTNTPNQRQKTAWITPVVADEWQLRGEGLVFAA